MTLKCNLLLPIAGKAQRFIDRGYTVPKPLVISGTKHLIDWALESVNIANCQLIFAVRLDHIQDFSIDDILRKKFGNATKIVVVDHITQGSVCTCLLAKSLIDNDKPLVIYTPDVYFQPQFDFETIPKDKDGFLLTFKANNPAHSYVQTDKDDNAIKTAEKQVISENAAVGVYYYRHGSMFVNYADKIISQKIMINNEFYICPMYNYMIQDGLKVGIRDTDKMHVLGTPDDLEFFSNNIIKKFTDSPIAICCDHSGYDLKETCLSILDSLNIDYIDFGTYVNKNCDYNDYLRQAIMAIKQKTCGFGMGFCRTGQGINILANQVKDIRSALVFDTYTAEYSVRHNCANFFSIPSKYVDTSKMNDIIYALKNTSFDGGRHLTRIRQKIK